MKLKAIVGNFEEPGPRKWGTKLTYFTDHPPNGIDDSENYFQPAIGRLFTGDQVVVSCLSPGAYRQARSPQRTQQVQRPQSWATATFEMRMVCHKRKLVIADRITDWRRGGFTQEEAARFAAQWASNQDAA